MIPDSCGHNLKIFLKTHPDSDLILPSNIRYNQDNSDTFHPAIIHTVRYYQQEQNLVILTTKHLKIVTEKRNISIA